MVISATYQTANPSSTKQHCCKLFVHRPPTLSKCWMAWWIVLGSGTLSSLRTLYIIKLFTDTPPQTSLCSGGNQLEQFTQYNSQIGRKNNMILPFSFKAANVSLHMLVAMNNTFLHGLFNQYAPFPYQTNV